MMMSSPRADSSKFRSGCSAQSWANASSVIGPTVRIAGRYASSTRNATPQIIATPRDEGRRSGSGDAHGQKMNRATDRKLGRDAALKILLPSLPFFDHYHAGARLAG